MVFSDPVFLFFFLPLVLAAYWAGAWRRRNGFLWMVGGAFYMWGGGAFIVLLVTSITLNYVASVRIARWRVDEAARARRLVRLTVAANVLTLATWKYGGFLTEQVGAGLRTSGLDANPRAELALPIAISFFTFQCISYVVDVWRGTSEPAPRLIDFGAYILLFPHLIAGPIVRYADIENDLRAPSRRRFDDFVVGAPRFFWGLGKKVLVADQVAAIANQVFALPDNRLNSAVAWVGVLAFAVQIYFDFSGYSDMAIGLARMFGFTFRENFDRPYSAVSVTDFWRRWHISLSTWFRDYVYIPLGGNRRGGSRTYVNLGVVFLLTGIWHGANWTFLVWGVFHGACLIVERVTGTAGGTAGRWAWSRRLLTFGLVCVGWAIFRADDLGQAGTVVRAMLVPSLGGLPATIVEILSNQRLLWFLVGLVVVALPGRAHIGREVSAERGRDALRLAVTATIAPVACVYALSSSFSPFLYFRF